MTRTRFPLSLSACAIALAACTPQRHAERRERLENEAKWLQSVHRTRATRAHDEGSPVLQLAYENAVETCRAAAEACEAIEAFNRDPRRFREVEAELLAARAAVDKAEERESARKQLVATLENRIEDLERKRAFPVQLGTRSAITDCRSRGRCS
jgi:hypothetical protein